MYNSGVYLLYSRISTYARTRQHRQTSGGSLFPRAEGTVVCACIASRDIALYRASGPPARQPVRRLSHVSRFRTCALAVEPAESGGFLVVVVVVVVVIIFSWPAPADSLFATPTFPSSVYVACG